MVNGEIVNAAKPHLLEFPGDGGAAVGQLGAVVEGLEHLWASSRCHQGKERVS